MLYWNHLAKLRCPLGHCVASNCHAGIISIVIVHQAEGSVLESYCEESIFVAYYSYSLENFCYQSLHHFGGGAVGRKILTHLVFPLAKVVQVEPAVLEPARKEPDVAVCLDHLELVSLGNAL